MGSSKISGSGAWLVGAMFCLSAFGQKPAHLVSPTPRALSRDAEPLVEVQKVCPEIVVDLRYASVRNLTVSVIYPAGARCLLRATVAAKLAKAAAELKAQGLRLKVWDAYRPTWAQKILWDRVKDPNFVSDPSNGQPMHARGVAVDVTLVSADGSDMPMPSDFDDFTSAASAHYFGKDPAVAHNLRILQLAMKAGGFYGMRTEWWHFVVHDFEAYGPVEQSLLAPPVPPASELDASVPTARLNVRAAGTDRQNGQP